MSLSSGIRRFATDHRPWQEAKVTSKAPPVSSEMARARPSTSSSSRLTATAAVPAARLTALIWLVSLQVLRVSSQRSTSARASSITARPHASSPTTTSTRNRVPINGRSTLTRRPEDAAGSGPAAGEEHAAAAPSADSINRARHEARRTPTAGAHRPARACPQPDGGG